MRLAPTCCPEFTFLGLEIGGVLEETCLVAAWRHFCLYVRLAFVHSHIWSPPAFTAGLHHRPCVLQRRMSVVLVLVLVSAVWR